MAVLWPLNELSARGLLLPRTCYTAVRVRGDGGWSDSDARLILWSGTMRGLLLRNLEYHTVRSVRERKGCPL